MPLFRRKRPGPRPAPGWASGSGSSIGAVPPSVVALVTEGRLPAEVAASFPDGPYGSGPDWLEVADVVDELTAGRPPLPGPLYALGACAHLEACSTMVDELSERSRRAAELLDLAVAHGVPPEELNGLYSWAESLGESGEEQAVGSAALAARDPETLHGTALADRAYELTDSADPEQVRAGAALYARLAEESAGDPDGVLDAQLRQELALHRAGDRNRALPRLAELATASSERMDTAHLLDSARMSLIVDAATYDGPEAARAAWERARRQSATFPGLGFAERLVQELRGRQVPWVMGELAQVLRARERLDRDARKALLAAEAELAQQP